MFKRSSASINLPSMPEAIANIINVTNSDASSVNELAEIVLLDQTLTSRVLRLANSALYTRMSKTETVMEAIMRLGSSQLRNLAASASVIEAVFPKKAFPGFNWKELWRHSVITAVASQALHAAIVGSLRTKDESVFIAGLLHDIGKMVIAFALPMKFARIVAQCYENGWDMHRAETKFIGTSHTSMGTQLAVEWELAEKLRVGIEYHHHPELASEYRSVAVAVSAGNMLAKRLGRSYIKNHNWDISLDQICKISELSPKDLQKVIVNTRDRLSNCDELVSWGDDLPEPEIAA